MHTLAKELFTAIYPDDIDGLIELRCFPEGGRPGRTIQRWLTRVQLLDQIDGIAEWGREKRYAVCAGMILRREEGSGKTDNLSQGQALWADMDWRDYEGGQEEARGLIEQCPFPPTAVVLSGHGYHCYWALSEPQEPADVQAGCSALERVLRSDSVHDAARVMRLPGTWNCKGDPILVEVEKLDTDLVYHLEDVLDLLGSDEDDGPSFPGDEHQSAGKWRRLLRNKFIRAPFELRGNSSSDGSRSGFAQAMANRAVEAGATDEQLADLMWAFQEKHGLTHKGRQWGQRSIVKAKKWHDHEDDDPVEIDKIERMSLSGGEGAVYVFHLSSGGTVSVDQSSVLSPAKMRNAWFCATNQVIDFGGPKAHAKRVAKWAREVVEVELPGEMSVSSDIRSHIGGALKRVRAGESYEDMTIKGCRVPGGSRWHISAETMKRAMTPPAGTTWSKTEVYSVVKGMGWVNGTSYVGGKSVYTWSIEEEGWGAL